MFQSLIKLSRRFLSLVVFLVLISSNTLFSKKPLALANPYGGCYMNVVLQTFLLFDQFNEFLLKNGEALRDHPVFGPYVALLEYRDQQIGNEREFIDATRGIPANICAELFESHRNFFATHKNPAADSVKNLVARAAYGSSNGGGCPDVFYGDVLNALMDCVGPREECLLKEAMYLKLEDQNQGVVTTPVLEIPFHLTKESKDLLDLLSKVFNPFDGKRIISLPANYLVIDNSLNEGIFTFDLDLYMAPYVGRYSANYGTRYELTAVIVRRFFVATPDGQNDATGHAVIYVKIGDQWYLCNDTVVVPVSDYDVWALGQNGVESEEFLIKSQRRSGEALLCNEGNPIMLVYTNQ